MSRGTDPRHIRGISDEKWDAYRDACIIVHGTDNRSEIIRKHIDETIAEAQRKTGTGKDE
ncbi:hypothetical protein [Actinomadura sp. 9N215]|uniref:hypothetical protein n=1 Tax=Actinomadura sp. 9N215 TaxID=3375150 RepID=UPI0037B37723